MLRTARLETTTDHGRDARRPRVAARLLGALAACAAATAAWASPASAASLASEQLSVGDAADQTCTQRQLSGEGVGSLDVTAPAVGFVRASLDAGSGDWDLAIFDASSGRTVAGGATLGPDEVAQGFVLGRADLVVQACRRSGGDETAELDVEHHLIDTGAIEKTSMVRVSTPTEADVAHLQSLGLDLTEHGGPGFMDVVLHGEDDAGALARAGLASSVLIPDLAQQSAEDRAAEQAYRASAAGGAGAGLPSGQDTYRRLFEYSEDLKQLADRNPGLVRYFTLPKLTYEGREVEGIEITNHVNRDDGKPVFLQMGLHHAREWPSGEHAIEWAYQLVNGYRSGNEQIRELVQNTRTIVVPVVNPDGFNTSREAGELQGAGDGRGGPDETANIVSHPNEYRRKNCRYVDDSDGGDCAQPAFGVESPGVDPNRNYGGLWGGPGASTVPLDEDYRGPGPFSEPETKNIRKLVSTNQVVTLITNHTFSNLVLRPPGIQAMGETVDEPLYKRLGDAMAAENGYDSQYGYQLYDTTGTTEDWSYNTTGGLGFTFEIGPEHFHPPFQDVVAEWNGTTNAAGDGGGNRAAYMTAQESTRNTQRHALIKGEAPRGTKLVLRKNFMTRTSKVIQDDGSEGDVIRFPDQLRTSLDVGPSGEFRWHINPSTRPIVAQSSGRDTEGPPSPPDDFAGAPGPSAQPCLDFETDDHTCWNDHAFTVPGGPGVDNAKARIRIDWTSPTSDWDMKIFRDFDHDGTSKHERKGHMLGSSAQGLPPTNFEEATVSEPEFHEGGDYVVRVINYSATDPYEGGISYLGPDPFQPAQKERWTLYCKEETGGEIREVRRILIERGEVQHLDLRSSCR